MRRELWEATVGMVEALVATSERAPGLRVVGAVLDLPTEVVVVRTSVGFRLLIDAPHYRWDVGLRPRPGRLRMEIGLAETEIETSDADN